METQAIIQAARDQKYEVKGIRTFTGMEGCGGFNATLYRDGKKVAFVINSDDGGCYQWEFGGYKSEEARRIAREEEAKLKALCESIPPEPIKFGDETHMMDCDMDTFIAALVGEWEETNYWRKKCKTHTCVILKSHTDGQYIHWKLPYDARIKKHILEKYGDDLKEIVNERFTEAIKV